MPKRLRIEEEYWYKSIDIKCHNWVKNEAMDSLEMIEYPSSGN